MRFSFLILLSVASIISKAQRNKEFEGIIKYSHKYYFDANSKDTVTMKNMLGTSSVFFYKRGNYKWVVTGEPGFSEYFDAKTQTTYSLYENADTLLRSFVHGADDSLVTLKYLEGEFTVCGKPCKAVETLTFTKDDTLMRFRRVLYYSKSVFIGEKAFSSYRTYASDKVFKLIKCWPIRIEIEAALLPKMILEAVEIIPMSLSNSEVYLPSDKPIKDWTNPYN